MNRTARGVIAAMTALAVTSCSFVVVDRAPSRPPDDPAAPISCSASNWGAGVDFTAFAISALVAGSLAGKSDNPDTELDEQDDARKSALAAGGVALLTGASMIYGFKTTGTCRSMRRARGEQVGGSNDWLLSIAVIATVGGAALARGGSSPNRNNDPDRCEPGDRITALCRDGEVSCSTNRSGTCSWHRGVARWY